MKKDLHTPTQAFSKFGFLRTPVGKKIFLFHLIFLFTVFTSRAQVSTTCTPVMSTGCTDGDYINAFVLNGVANPNNGGCNNTTTAYTLFTTPVYTLLTGQTYTYSVTHGPTYSQGFSIWIDLNNDGIYSTGEQLSNISAALTHTGSITIPSSATTATNVAMRTRCLYNTTFGTGNSESCQGYTYGETEDYRIVIAACPVPSVTVTPAVPAVCAGNTLALTATNAGTATTTFTWSNGLTNGGAFTPTASAIYTLSVLSGGCLTTRTVGVTYNPPLTISGPSANVCANTSITLIANGGTSYTWSTGGTASSEVVVPTANVTYTVFGMSTAGCASQGVKTLTVDPGIPSITASTSAGTGVCPGKTITVNATGAATYTWTGVTPPVTNNVSFSLATTSTLTVTAGNSCGTSTAALTLSIHPIPSVTPVASSSTLCSGTSLTLTGVGTATAYTWSGAAVNGAGFNPAVSATYTVIGTSALSCTASATIPITVITTPSVASVISPSLICIGKSSTLTASGAASYNWSGDISPATTNSYVVTPTVSGISSYTIVRANSTCTTSQVVNVITNNLPTVFAISSPTLVCANKPTTLTVAGGQTYTWTSPGNPPTVASFSFTGASPLAFPPVPTTYTVAAHDGTCVNTTTVFVQVDPNPTIVTTANSNTLCSGSTATINASGGLNYTVTSSANSTTYSSFPIVETLTTSTAYNVTADNSFGCSTSTIQFVQVFGTPTLTAIPNKSLVCSGGSATVTATGANTYLWSNGVTTSTAIVNPVSLVTGPVIFTVTGTFTNTLCYTDKTVAVGVFIPTLGVTGNTSICAGGTLVLTANGGTGANNYRWYTVPGAAATSSLATLNSTLSGAAVFTVTGLTTSGSASLCPSTKTIDVNLFFNPTITATASRTQICVKESMVLNGNGAVSYLWSTGFNTQTITVSPNSTTNYTVTRTDVNGCSGTGTIQVKVSACSGIAEQNAANIGLNVYPNPNNGEFTIQSLVELNLTLVNDLGQLIRVIELSGANNYKVDVNDLAKGIYFLSGQKDNQQVNQKIIISK